jgi:hypothetical protein
MIDNDSGTSRSQRLCHPGPDTGAGARDDRYLAL